MRSPASGVGQRIARDGVMSLKSVSLLGFKSFAERTEFNFEGGLTAIVGPNGCGKSNLVDAIKWVLGEQRPRSLRSLEMADVIYRGNGNGRKSLAFAEATVVLDNQSRILPIEYTEVAITRRVYRSGESEYFINNNQCRLRDIRELLMGTGIGVSSYSVIEQDQVSRIIQATPVERRIVFEEAVGISRYKAKRRASLLNLERVEQNLLRVNDRISTVQRQLRSTKRQASLARRYKQYRDELRQIELRLAQHHYLSLSQKLCDIQSRISSVEKTRSSHKNKLAEFQGREETLLAEQRRLQDKLTSLRAEQARLNSTISSLQQALKLDHTRLDELSTQKASLEAQSNENRKRIEKLEAELANLRSTKSNLSAEISSLDNRIRSHQESLKELEAQIERSLDSISEKRSRLAEHEHHRIRTNNELIELQSQIRLTLTQHSRTENRLSRLNETLASLNARHSELRLSLQRAVASRQAVQNDLLERTQHRDRADEELHTLQTAIDSLNSELASVNSRLNVLKDIVERGADLKKGNLSILRKRASLSGVLGHISELITVPPLYAPATEAALGELADSVVVEGSQAVLLCAQLLDSADGGSATLLQTDRLRPSDPPSSAPEGSLLASQLITSYQCESLKYLLQTTIVVPDLQRALEIYSASRNGFAIVTLKGERIDPSGLVHLRADGSQQGPIVRRTELRQLSERLNSLQQELDTLSQKRHHLLSLSSSLEADIRALSEKDSALEREISSLQLEISTTEREKETTLDEVEVLRGEIDSISSEIRKARERELELTSELTRISEKEEALRNALHQDESSLQSLESQADQTQKTLTSLRVAFAEKKARLDALLKTVTDIRNSTEASKHTLLSTLSRIQQCTEKSNALQASISEHKLQLSSSLEKQKALASQVPSVDNQLQAIDSDLTSLRSELQSTQSALSETDTIYQELRIEQNKIELETNSLAERVHKDWNENLPQLASSYQPVDVDWDQERRDAEILRKKISSMQNINLSALDELTSLENELSFLEREREDILRSKNNLQEIINRTNRQSRLLFEKGFSEIRAHFQSIFRKLFEGGRADITLEEGKDILEAGILITAQPPGKNPRTIDELSGGEKVLCTIALLLAVFKSKPSPFCVLDEVDAALDESNVDRFIALIRELCKSSQFIIITHCKRTMCAADVIYGVTMEEAGVSKKISIDFRQIGQGFDPDKLPTHPPPNGH